MPDPSNAPNRPSQHRRDAATASPDTNKDAGPSYPPRIVVELPDGGVCLGEDDARLESERQATAQQQQQSQGQASLPGTEVWLDMRRLLYATALDTLILTRKRHAAVLLSAPPLLLQFGIMHALRDFVLLVAGCCRFWNIQTACACVRMGVTHHVVELCLLLTMRSM